MAPRRTHTRQEQLPAQTGDPMPDEQRQRDATRRRYWLLAAAGLAVVAGGLAAGVAMLWPTDQADHSRQVTQPELRTRNRPPDPAAAEAGPEGIPWLPKALPALVDGPDDPEGLVPLQVQDYLRLSVEAQCVCRAREAADSASELAHCRAPTGRTEPQRLRRQVGRGGRLRGPSLRSGQSAVASVRARRVSAPTTRGRAV